MVNRIRNKRIQIPKNDGMPVEGGRPSPIPLVWRGKILPISGWLAAAFMGALNLPGAINSFVKEYPAAAESTGIWLPIDQRITGDWSAVQSCSLDHIDLPDLSDSDEQLRPKVGLDLHLEVQGKIISGSILSKGLSANAPQPEAFLAGLVDGTTARLQVFDWIDGKPVVFSNIKVLRTRSGCLEFEVADSGRSRFFPTTAVLARQSPGYFDGLPREGGLLKQAIEDVVRNMRQNLKR